MKKEIKTKILWSINCLRKTVRKGREGHAEDIYVLTKTNEKKKERTVHESLLKALGQVDN